MHLPAPLLSSFGNAPVALGDASLPQLSLPQLSLPEFPPTSDVEPWVVGVGIYVVGLAALTAWEEVVVPSLGLRSITPEAPLGLRQFSRRERDVPFLTPWTADLPVPPPPYERLETPFCIGSRGAVQQFIVKSESEIHEVEGVVEKSRAWTEHYGADVIIYKQRKG